MSAGAAKLSGSAAKLSGSPAEMPTVAASCKHASATLRPIGPTTEIGDQPTSLREFGTSPGVGRKPTTPHLEAGMRNEPPVSEPVHTGSMSHASAAAEPPDEPPAFNAVLNGLPVAPHTGLRVFAPAPSSGTLVFAVTIAPAARRRSTSTTSCVGTLPRDIGEP